MDHQSTNVVRQRRRGTEVTHLRKGTCSKKNVGPLERVGSGGLGALLITRGLAGTSWPARTVALIGAGLLYRSLRGYCSIYESLGIDTAHPRGKGVAVRAKQGGKCAASVVIRRTPGELFEYWRELSNLPILFDDLDHVTEQGDISHWAVTTHGHRIEWDAEIHNVHAGKLLAWRSIPGGDLDTAGSIRLHALGGDRGTAAHLTMKYSPPAGKVGVLFNNWTGEGLQQQIETALRRFKQLMETGETASIADQPRGSCS